MIYTPQLYVTYAVSVYEIYQIRIYHTLYLYSTYAYTVYIVLPGKINKRGSRDSRAEVESTRHFYDMMVFVLDLIKHLFHDGFEVWDSRIQEMKRLVLKIVVTIEDGKGCPRVVGCKSDNAYHGACPFCTITGITYKIYDDMYDEYNVYVCSIHCMCI